MTDLFGKQVHPLPLEKKNPCDTHGCKCVIIKSRFDLSDNYSKKMIDLLCNDQQSHFIFGRPGFRSMGFFVFFPSPSKQTPK